MEFNFMGVGAAGNKAVRDLIDMGITDVDHCVLVNSTDKDFPDNYTGNKKILCEDNVGCGKERTIAKEYAIRAIESGMFDDLFARDVIVVTSVEGGTGSGAAPILAEYVKEVVGKNVHIFCFLGFEDDTRGLQNTVEFFQEISAFDPDVITICNKSFLVDANNNRFKAEQLANKELAKKVKVLMGTSLQKSEQNIDETDIFKVVNTSGYKIIESVEFGSPLTDVQQFNKLCKQLCISGKSLRPVSSGIARLGVVLNIAPETEASIDTEFREFKEYFGTPHEIFIHKQYDGKKEYIQVIASGLKLPFQDVENIFSKYEEESAKVDKSEDDFNSRVSSFMIKPEDRKFDMVRKGNKTVEKSSFLRAFETRL